MGSRPDVWYMLCYLSSEIVQINLIFICTFLESPNSRYAEVPISIKFQFKLKILSTPYTTQHGVQ